MLCGGHVLLEDVPGVGKTRLVAALARSVNGKFNRIQLTPDVMPTDIMGFNMLNLETKAFEYREGVAMCNFLLADEINRASPKVQSGLLEIMEERQVSIDAVTMPLPRPFMVLATQNPVETYGTYQLPEAQLDRFLIRISLGYLDPYDEVKLLDPSYQDAGDIRPVLGMGQIVALQEEVKRIFSHALVRDYIMRIVSATRLNDNITLGVSPRGTIGLHMMAKAAAFISGRPYITPDDVVTMAPGVLAHRIILSSKGKGVYQTQEAAIEEIIRRTPLPAPAGM